MSLRVDLVWSVDFVPGQQQRLESQKSPLAAISSVKFPENSSLKEFRPNNTFHFRVMEVDILFSPKNVPMSQGPMKYRKWMELAEATITDQSVNRGATTVEFTAFGVYARSLDGVGVRPGDYLAVKNPRVQDWDEKENPIQMFVGLKLEDLGQRVAVLRGVEDALREVSSVGSNTATEDQSCSAEDQECPRPESIPPTSPTRAPTAVPVSVPVTAKPGAPVPVPVPAKPGGKARVYTKLRDCSSLSKVKYNAWAVVVSVSKQPGPTKGKKLMGQVYIRDQGFTGYQGKADMQFSLLADDMGHFPPLVEGSTMRIHNMAMETFNGERTGRVYDARSVVVIRNDVTDKEKFEPESAQEPAKLIFSEEDLFCARLMRKFWQGMTATSGTAEKRGEEDRSPIIMSSVATNTIITEEEAAVVEELGMDELLHELRKSPEKAEEEDVFTDSTLFREAAEQLDAADEQVPVTVPMITVPVPAVPGGSPTQGTQESSFEWNNSTAPMSVASQDTMGADSCPIFKHTYPQMTMDVIRLPKSPPVPESTVNKSPVPESSVNKSPVPESSANKSPMSQAKSRTSPRVLRRTSRGRKQVPDSTDGGGVAPKKSDSTRSTSSTASSSSIVSASSNSVSYVPKEKTLMEESSEDSQEFFTCPKEKTLLEESSEESQGFFTCPTTQSSDTTIPEPNPGYAMEEVEDEFV